MWRENIKINVKRKYKNTKKRIPSVSSQMTQKYNQSHFGIQTRSQWPWHSKEPRPRRLTKVLQPSGVLARSVITLSKSGSVPLSVSRPQNTGWRLKTVVIIIRGVWKTDHLFVKTLSIRAFFPKLYRSCAQDRQITHSPMISWPPCLSSWHVCPSPSAPWQTVHSDQRALDLVWRLYLFRTVRNPQVHPVVDGSEKVLQTTKKSPYSFGWVSSDTLLLKRSLVSISPTDVW